MVFIVFWLHRKVNQTYSRILKNVGVSILWSCMVAETQETAENH